MRLRGRIALVTGAQQGIGRGIALAFAREGADVAVNYLDDRAAAEKVLREVHAAGRRAVLVQADVARPTDAQTMVAQVLSELGGLDVLVNNAGVYPRVPFLEMRETDWDLVLDVNLKGGFFCAQAAARAMVAAGRRGSIINMASQAIRGAVRGVHGRDDTGDGARAGTARDSRECDRARAHRHRPAALWEQRGGAGGDGERGPARTHGAAGRYRRRRGVSRQ